MASGDTLQTFLASDAEYPAANYATLDLRGNHPVLDFDGAANETIYFSSIMPRAYAAGGVTVYLHWASSDITGDVDWDVAFERIGDQQQDLDSAGFASANSVDNTTVPGTSGLVDVVSVAFTNGAAMDSVAAGESFRLSITRDAASDTSTGDAQLLAVEIKET